MSEFNPTFEEAVAIDSDALDLECLNHPKTLMYFSERCSQAERNCDEFKLNLTKVRAEEEAEIRANPANYDLEKITEAALVGVLNRDTSIQTLEKELNEARYQLSILKGVMQSLHAKSSMLKILADLFQSNYFSGPTAPRPLTRGFDKTETVKTQRTALKTSKKGK